MTDTVATAENPVDIPQESSAVEANGLFVFCCLTLPVLWGVLVHAVFKKLRPRPKRRKRADDWPDYQI